MSNLNSRLGRIERAADVLDADGACRMCWGEPLGNVFETHVFNGRGFSKTGERYLDPAWFTRITDDLRCRGCGRLAIPTKTFIVVGMGPQMPEGARRLEPMRVDTANPEQISTSGVSHARSDPFVDTGAVPPDLRDTD